MLNAKIRYNNSEKAQATMEFTFCMIIVLLMMFGVMMTFRWAGLDLAERRIAHDDVLTDSIVGSYSYVGRADGPMKQLSPHFYDPISMNTVWKGHLDY